LNQFATVSTYGKEKWIVRYLNSKVFSSFVYLFVLFLASHTGFAQAHSQEQESTRWWVNLCTARDAYSLSINIKRYLLWVVRVSRSNALAIVYPFPEYEDLGFLIGEEWNTRWLSASTAAGIGYTNIKLGSGSNGHDYPMKAQYATIGFPLEAHIVVTPLSFFGVGIGIIGNINLKKSILSEIGFTLRFGNL
jgi:hypothetical protein